MVIENSHDIELARKELLEKAKILNKKTVGDIDFSHLLDNPKNKGRVGQVIQVFLGKNLDNDKGADFPEANLELKVTGLLANSKASYRAKERLVLHDINYVCDHNVTFENSSLLSKCETMLVTCYKYIPSKTKGISPEYSSFPIIDSFIYELTEKDLTTIKDDYDIILDKINNGRAEMLSESDTQYLAACTKAANSLVRTKQFGSSILVKPRAFSLKPSFLTAIIKKNISNYVFENLDDLLNASKNADFETAITDKLKPWYGKTESDLSYAFPEVSASKDKFARYISRIIGKKDLEKTEEFQKANIHIKTIRVEKNGIIKESMSFGGIEFEEVARTSWEDSSSFAYFEGSRFLFLVFRNDGKQYLFEKAMFYNLPDIVTDGFMKYTYEATQKTLLSGKIVKEIKLMTMKKDQTLKTRYLNYFVSSKENPVVHVRPHGQNFWSPQKRLPVEDSLTKFTKYEVQCFWLDKKYIQSILENRDGDYLSKANQTMLKNGFSFDFSR
jgi:DNA mismatch repair protein